MKNSVMIKGNKHGIIVVLNEETAFETLSEEIREKFEQSAKFFGNADMAISFEGRKLSLEEQRTILDIIATVTNLNIVCVLEEDEEQDKKFTDAIEKAQKPQRVSEEPSGSGQFYKGTLRSGQVLEAESSIIILGDVNPGGRIIAKGNVIILGSLRGNVFAGANGNEDAFVVALEMHPMQIKIGDVIARSSDSAPARKGKGIQPKIAYVDDSNIYIENLDQEVLEDIRIN